MADSKITALTSISTSTDPANDPLVIVDVSDTSMAATGTTKKVTLNQLLGASGTATLASATITGDLTVDTSTLKVDSALNKVGVGVATLTGLQTFNVAGDVGITSDLVLKNSGGTVQGYIFGSSGINYRVIAGQPHVWQEGGSDLMRLNSTGLGVGVVPSAKLDVSANDGTMAIFRSSGGSSNDKRLTISTGGAKVVFNISDNSNTATARAYEFQTAGSAAMTLDASGNLLVGTTSASTTSGSGFKVTQPAAGHFDASIVTSANSSIYSCWDIYSTGGTAGYRFYVTSNGTINAVNTTISAISDARLKENVQDIDVGLGAILALKPRKFDWKEGKGKNIKGDRGFIAQEFEQVFPQLVDEWKDAAPEGEAPYKSVRQDLIPVLVKAIQELTARVQTLETR